MNPNMEAQKALQNEDISITCDIKQKSFKVFNIRKTRQKNPSDDFRQILN